MLKYYKDINAYATENNICRQTAAKEINSGKAKLYKIKKGFKYIKVIED